MGRDRNFGSRRGNFRRAFSADFRSVFFHQTQEARDGTRPHGGARFGGTARRHGSIRQQTGENFVPRNAAIATSERLTLYGCAGTARGSPNAGMTIAL